MQSHKFQKSLFELIKLKRVDRVEKNEKSLKKDVENITSSKFDFKFYENESQKSDFHLTIFSESYDTNISVNDYGKILIIAKKFNIVAQLLYLRELIREFNNYQIRTRKIRLI